MPLQNLAEEPRSTDAPVPKKEECDAMLDLFMKAHKDDEKHKMTEEEATKFKSAFEDEKFRAILADYMEEISDPKHREETEAYITQLEGEDQVPAGKELVRPESCFVVKSYIQSSDATETGEKAGKGEKIFVNIVQVRNPNDAFEQKWCQIIPLAVGLLTHQLCATVS